MPRPRPVPALVVALLLLLATGCGSDDGGAAPPVTEATTIAPPTEVPAPTEGPGPGDGGGEALRILVSNDDAYDAEGLDVVVEALLTLDDVEVTVVAPLEGQSGQGGKRTEGELATTDEVTLSGHPVVAVDGFPTDAVRVAVDELGIEPHVVVSGSNEGQNIGPSVDLSGTIGAARAAVARDIPSIAVSQGRADPLDYEAAVPLLLDWLAERRPALLDGTAPVEVANLNVPSCTSGEVRGLVEVGVEGDRPFSEALAVQDCESTEDLGDDAGDVTAFLVGFATLSIVPDEPAEPAEVVTP